MQNLKAGHAGTASSGLNHNGLSQKGNFFPSKLKVAAPRLSEKETYQDTDLQKTTCLRKFRPATRR